MDDVFELHEKKVTVFLRPYEPGEDLENIEVNKGKTILGGMIARSTTDRKKKDWYMSPKEFEDYVPTHKVNERIKFVRTVKPVHIPGA